LQAADKKEFQQMRINLLGRSPEPSKPGIYMNQMAQLATPDEEVLSLDEIRSMAKAEQLAKKGADM
jgi:hypothetical protein